MAKQKKYHYIYKTTCNITGKFYVGMHSTDNFNDGYLGSGKILGYSRRKHGDENHTKEILFYCSSRDELKQKEKEVVNEELLANPLNINLKYGGDGGGLKWSDEHQRIWSSAGGKNSGKMHKGSDLAKQSALKSSRTVKERINAGSLEPWHGRSFLGKKHSEETKQKMRKSKNQGEANSQFGTCWVTNGIKPCKIKITQLDEYLSNGFKRGRV